MKTLIDTHALLWLISNDEKLSALSKQHFLDANNTLFFSMASFWEICIKVSIGRLKLSGHWERTLQNELSANSIHLLPVSTEHCMGVTQLPFHHRDPFDRMIIAQALVEKMNIMSVDSSFAQYDVDVIW